MPRTDGAPLPVVGVSSNVLEPRLNGGRLDGIGTYTRALLRSLASHGVPTRRVGAIARHGASFVRPGDADVEFPIPQAWSIAATALTRAPTALAGRVEGAIDLYHATDYLVPRLRRTPVVATLYDAIPLARPDWGNRRLRGLKNFMLKSAAASADLVIAISRAAVDEIVEHYRVPRERVRVIPLGVDEAWFAPPSQAALDALRARGVRDGCFLFVGTLQPRKNVDALVDSYDLLPEAVRRERQLVVAGKYGWGVEALRDRLAARRPEGDVLWLDYVPQDELRALFSIARAFVFPSLAEGFGLPVLEAFAAGTPVIASDIPALREVARDHASYVDPRDAGALARAMERLGGTVPDAAAIEDARRHAREMDWGATARRTVEVYAELLPALRSLC